MNEINSDNNISNISQYGDKHKNKQSSINTEAILLNKGELNQIYTGLYLEKCYHNIGIYKWTRDNNSYVYEGKFYANDLHGYGKLLYPDKSEYEGLFFHNERFGPGIITYPNGQQDVGIWNGHQLIRLSKEVNLNDFYLNRVPCIAKTVQGKLYLLQFKVIVPLEQNENDPIVNVMNEFHVKAEHREKFYSKYVRNYKSSFMNIALFNKNFYTDPKDLILDVFDHLDENDDPVIYKIPAANLIAWNNDDLYIDILKHTFINRKYEKIVSYKIRNVLFENGRKSFLPEGPIEQKCVMLLVACRDGDTLRITNLICGHDLYPDLSDCHGNTTLLYAAVTNKQNAIRTLVNLGANVNAINDESLTALMLCLLHYIAIKNNVLDSNWESTFLKLTPIEKDSLSELPGKLWPEGSDYTTTDISSLPVHISETTVRSNKFKKQKLKESQFIFSTMCNLKEISTTDSSTGKKHSKMNQKQKPNIECIELDKLNALGNIEKTIVTLLECGADPNLYEVPFPPIIAVLFTQNVKLIQLFLDHKVNVNVKTSSNIGDLTPLHILCAMDLNENILEIANILLNYSLDVNALSNMDHWPTERDKLLGGVPSRNEEEFGKTALHMIAMRYDFSNKIHEYQIKMIRLLVAKGANVTAQYTGHNILSLAALRGNQKLVEYLLENRLIDVNTNLGYNMGGILTMLSLFKYVNLLPSEYELVYKTLFKYNANPFADVPNFPGNAIDSAKYEDEQFKNRENKALRALMELSLNFLRRYIDSQALQILLSGEQCNVKNPNFQAVAKYLDVEKGHRILQMLLDYNNIPPDVVLFINVLHFIHKHTSSSKFKKLKFKLQDEDGIIKTYRNVSSEILNYDNENKEKKNYTKYTPSTRIMQIIYGRNTYLLELNKNNKEDIMKEDRNNIPEIDEGHKKYIVCYGCLQSFNKKLQLCPFCKLVYFCSVQCNVTRNISGDHPCNRLFYNNRKPFDVFRKASETSFPQVVSSLKEKLFKIDGVRRSKAARENVEGSYLISISSRESAFSHRSKKKKKSTSKEENRFFKLEKKICTSPCRGKLVAIGFKEPLEEVEKKLRYKPKLPELKPFRGRTVADIFNGKFAADQANIDLMLRVAKRVNLQLVPVTDPALTLNPCDPFDYKFWQLFLPYCVYQDGELFYRFNDQDLLYKLPYKKN